MSAFQCVNVSVNVFVCVCTELSKLRTDCERETADVLNSPNGSGREMIQLIHRERQIKRDREARERKTDDVLNRPNGNRERSYS